MHHKTKTKIAITISIIQTVSVAEVLQKPDLNGLNVSIIRHTYETKIYILKCQSSNQSQFG